MTCSRSAASVDAVVYPTIAAAVDASPARPVRIVLVIDDPQPPETTRTVDDPSTPDAEATPTTPEERGRSLRRAASLTAMVGIAFSVLFTVGFALTTAVPSGKATDQEIYDYYSSGRRRLSVVVGLYLLPLAGIAFLWFIVTLRMWAAASARQLNALQSNMQLISGILFVALFFIAAAASSVLAVSVQYSEGEIDPDSARQFPLFGGTVLVFFGMRMAAIFVFTTSAMGRSAGILPRWFGLTGFVVGLFLLLSSAFSPILVMIFPAWVLVLSLILLRNARAIPRSVRLPGRMGAGSLDPIGANRVFAPRRPVADAPVEERER